MVVPVAVPRGSVCVMEMLAVAERLASLCDATVTVTGIGKVPVVGAI
jgi:hypothetical protein